MRRVRVQAALCLLLLLPVAPTPTAAWGNGCSTCNPGYPYYGVHDAIANASLAWVEALAPERAAWIEDWFLPMGGDSGASYEAARTAPGPRDNWLAWTDDPDTALQDWPNHLFIVHPRPGADERGAPGRVAALLDQAVENLTLAKRLGAAGMAQQHRAAYLMGLLSHYVGDVSQFGHTDDTRRDHRRPADDPLGRTYHGYYESVTWNSAGLGALDAALRATEPLAPVEDAAAEVEALARWVNARDGRAVAYLDADGATVTVGAGYAWNLDRYVAQYDAGLRLRGMRGWDAALWDTMVENTRAATHLLARLIAEADARASQAANQPPKAIIAPVDPVECEGGVGTVTLDGSASRDPDGDALAFRWSSSQATFEDAAAPVTSATFPLGGHTATLAVSDGRLEDIAEATVEVRDTVAPAARATPSGLMGLAGWWRSPVEVALTGSDACGVAALLAGLDGAPLEPRALLVVGGDGLHALAYAARDLGGNLAPEQVLRLALDGAPPSTRADLDGLQGQEGWWRSSVEAAFSCQDATSGCAATFAGLDGAAPSPRQGARVGGDGTHALAFSSEDVAGNREAEARLEVRIDATPPATAAALDGLAGRAGWWRSAVDATLTCADATSGCRGVEAALDGAPAGTTLQVRGDGAHDLRFRARDLAGNEEAEQLLRVPLDTQPPATRAALQGLQGLEGWWRSAVDVVLAASDAASGVAAVWQALDGAAFAEGAGLEVAGDGRHKVRFYAEDVAGNAEAIHALEVAVDATPPALALLHPAEGAAYVLGTRVPLPRPLPATLVAGDLLVEAHAEDATSGMARVEFRVDGALRHVAESPPWAFAWAAGEEALGRHILEARAFDLAGNEARAARQVMTAPTSPEGLAATLCRLPLPAGACEALGAP